MASNTKKQMWEIDWVYAEKVQSSVGRSAPEANNTPQIMHLLHMQIRRYFNKICDNKHSESISKSGTENFWFKIHALNSPYAFLFLQSVVQNVYFRCNFRKQYFYFKFYDSNKQLLPSMDVNIQNC